MGRGCAEGVRGAMCRRCAGGVQGGGRWGRRKSSSRRLPLAARSSSAKTGFGGTCKYYAPVHATGRETTKHKETLPKRQESENLMICLARVEELATPHIVTSGAPLLLQRRPSFSLRGDLDAPSICRPLQCAVFPCSALGSLVSPCSALCSVV